MTSSFLYSLCPVGDEWTIRWQKDCGLETHRISSQFKTVIDGPQSRLVCPISKSRCPDGDEVYGLNSSLESVGCEDRLNRSLKPQRCGDKSKLLSDLGKYIQSFRDTNTNVKIIVLVLRPFRSTFSPYPVP